MTERFLDRIVAATEQAIRAPGYLDGLPERRPGGRPSLRAAIQGAGPTGALLAEFKRRSPGQANPELPSTRPVDFVRRIEPAGVAGYSCLATGPEFGGSPQDVADVVRATSRPVLFKDFIVDPLQIEAAARAGASAVLLIARLETQGLLRHPLASLAERAHAQGLEVLLEWHERAELRRTAHVAADMYGVNVRDLDSLAIDRSRAAETILAATSYRPLLGLSGVDRPEEAQRFWQQGVDGILVGSALARAADPVAFLDSLRGVPARGPA